VLAAAAIPAKGAAATPSTASPKTDSCRRRHRSGRVSRRTKREGERLLTWRPRTGRDRAGADLVQRERAPTVVLTVSVGMACTIERHWLRGRTMSGNWETTCRLDGVEIRPRDHEAGCAGLPQARLSVDVRVLSAHRTLNRPRPMCGRDSQGRHQGSSICGAGGAAHLAGSGCPHHSSVIGVPIVSAACQAWTRFCRLQ